MMESKRFVNPYSFIPLSDQKAKAYSDSDCHTGVIHYAVKTKTPLFIPNTSSENAFQTGSEHKSYDFFSYNELEIDRNYEDSYFEPIIPGSELRGMVRNLYETLTDSCMSVFNDEVYPERRTGDVFLPGIIEKTGRDYKLYKARAYKLADEFKNNSIIMETYKEGQKLYFTKANEVCKGPAKVKDYSAEKEVGLTKEGYLIKGMPLSNKKNCYIFELTEGEPIRILNQSDIERLEAVLTSYQEQPGAENAYMEYRTGFNKFLKENEGYFPVRYSLIPEIRDVLYLSPAAFTKEIANTPLKKIIGDFRACETFQNCCPACDLFGMIGLTSEEAIGGKVRFSDARVKDPGECSGYYDNIITRELLGSPKLSNPEFYLQRPKGADAWNYDYYIKGGKIYPYTEKNPLRLRGRKYYYHQKDVIFPKNVEKSNLNATIRPVKQGIVFEGKLFFDNISKRQLRQLLWILNGGTKEDRPETKPLCYKLGSGKPLGFGSVELQVLSCTERVVSLENNTFSYKEKEVKITPDSYFENGFSETIKEDFISISTFDYVDYKEVSYPYVIDEQGNTKRIGTTVEKGFEWFQHNKGSGKDRVKKRVEARIETTLPSIRDKYLEPKFISSKGKNEQKNKKPLNQASSKQNNTKFEKGQVIKGVVIEHKKNKIRIQLENGRKINLHFLDVINRNLKYGQLDKGCPLNSELNLTYHGKNDQGNEQWKGEVL